MKVVSSFYPENGNYEIISTKEFAISIRKLLTKFNDADFSIFCDPQAKELLERSLPSINGNRCSVIPLQLNDTEVIRTYLTPTYIFNDNAITKMLTWVKYELIKRVINNKQCSEDTIFAYIDLELFYSCKTLDISGQLQLTTDEVVNIMLNIENQPHIFDTRFFYGTKKSLSELCTYIFHFINEFINNLSTILTDTSILSLIYQKKNQLFRLWYGRKDAILCNYCYPIIKNQLIKCVEYYFNNKLFQFSVNICNFCFLNYFLFDERERKYIEYVKNIGLNHRF